MRVILVSLSFALLPCYAYAVQSEAERYQNCTALALSAPDTALEKANTWLKKDSRNMAALHCKAMSLFSNGKYEESTVALESILKLYHKKKRDEVWLNIEAQAARAYAQANQPKKSESHLTQAINWAGENGKTKEIIPLLQQRAVFYQQQNTPLKAVNDLDYAISIAPTSELLLQRAELLIKIGKPASAKEDIDNVLTQDATNNIARALLQQIQKPAQ